MGFRRSLVRIQSPRHTKGQLGQAVPTGLFFTVGTHSDHRADLRAEIRPSRTIRYPSSAAEVVAAPILPAAAPSGIHTRVSASIEDTLWAIKNAPRATCYRHVTLSLPGGPGFISQSPRGGCEQSSKSAPESESGALSDHDRTCLIHRVG